MPVIRYPYRQSGRSLLPRYGASIPIQLWLMASLASSAINLQLLHRSNGQNISVLVTGPGQIEDLDGEPAPRAE